jgi:hypothetical protein
MAGRAQNSILMALPMLAVLVFTSAVLAQDAPPRPAIEELLPETTAAFLQIDNVQESLPKLMGAEMLEDENIGPFVQRMYDEAEAAYTEVTEGKVGMSLEQIKDLPAGELCLAVIAPRRKDLEYLIAVDIDPESESAEIVAQSRTEWTELLADKGLTETVETTDSGVEIYSYDLPDMPKKAHAFVRDGWFVSCTARDELEAVLARWEGLEVEKVRPLKENRKFVTVMNRCRPTEDIQPEIRYFADPISLARGGFRGNTIAQGVLAFLPKVGLDGVLGLGGSISLQSEEFNSVSHAHLLLANPRAGILEMLALKPGDGEPQPWIPADATNYISTHWDPMQAVNEFEKIVDTFSPDGEFQKEVVVKLKERTGLDFYEDVVNTVDGRFTYLEWADPETEFLMNARSRAVALGVVDMEKAKEVVDELINMRAGKDGKSGSSTVEHEGVPMWVFDPPSEEIQALREKRTKERVGDLPMRFSDPAFCLLDNSLILCDSADMVKHLIDVSLGNAPSMAEDEEYTQQMQRLTEAAGSDVPCAVTFFNPEGPIRQFFKLMGDERSATMVEKMSEKNPMLARFQTALAEQPLPEFDLIKRYFRPTGMIVTTDDTGYHMLAFQYGPSEE